MNKKKRIEEEIEVVETREGKRNGEWNKGKRKSRTKKE